MNDMIQFGAYSWRVLDRQNGKALILSEGIIEKRPYHPYEVDITWAECDLHDYLNGVNEYHGQGFYDRFSPQDKDRIAETRVVTNNNPWHGTPGGKAPNDKIFLLSIEEAVQYLCGIEKENITLYLDKNNQECKWGVNDQYNAARIAVNESGVADWWWLRSPGDEDYSAAEITDDGSIDITGNLVQAKNIGVRPALWLIYNV